MRICLALGLATAAESFSAVAQAPLRHPPLGVNASWVGEKVAEGGLFVARAATYGFVDDEILANLRTSVFAPYYEAHKKREPQLSLRGDRGDRAAPEEGLLDWLLDSMGDAVEGDSARDIRLSAVLRLEKLFGEVRAGVFFLPRPTWTRSGTRRPRRTRATRSPRRPSPSFSVSRSSTWTAATRHTST